mgnify:CR=1 FL=1
MTVTVKEHVAVFPAPSVARKVFVVTPTGKVAPLARPAICVTTGEEVQLSIDVGVGKVAIALHVPIPAFKVIFEGQPGTAKHACKLLTYTFLGVPEPTFELNTRSRLIT